MVKKYNLPHLAFHGLRHDPRIRVLAFNQSSWRKLVDIEVQSLDGLGSNTQSSCFNDNSFNASL